MSINPEEGSDRFKYTSVLYMLKFFAELYFMKPKN